MKDRPLTPVSDEQREAARVLGLTGATVEIYEDGTELPGSSATPTSVLIAKGVVRQETAFSHAQPV